MELHFPWTKLEKAFEELDTAQTVKTLYGEETGKGFWLVGDHGVYLMPNTSDGKHNGQRKEDEKLLVVYAKECDPDKLDFDTWWENKRASFGGDDGADFIGVDEVRNLASKPPVLGAKPKYLVIDIKPDQFGLGVVWQKTH